MKMLRIVVVLVCLVSGASLSHAAPVQLDDGNTLTVIADKTVTGSATLISAANASRAALNCTNTHATVHVRWGGSNVTAAVGQRLPATLSIAIRNTGAIYMISEGASVTVSCTEEVR